MMNTAATVSVVAPALPRGRDGGDHRRSGFCSGILVLTCGCTDELSICWAAAAARSVRSNTTTKCDRNRLTLGYTLISPVMSVYHAALSPMSHLQPKVA